MTPSPHRPLLTRPATPAQTPPRDPATPPNRPPPGNITVEDPAPRLNTHPNASYPQIPGGPGGIGTTYEDAPIATATDSPAAFVPRHPGRGYTSSQPLPNMEDRPVLPIHQDRRTSPYHGEAPAPYPWEPKFLPEQWVHTDGSDIIGHPRLGAAVVHIPTNTAIYIDAAGAGETRTITRAELVAIHTALTTLSTHEWICIFTDSLSSLQAIRQHHTNPGTSSAKHYHHHKLLLGSINDLLETRRLSCLCTTLHK